MIEIHNETGMIMKKELMILCAALALAGCDQAQRGSTGSQSETERGTGSRMTNDMGATSSRYDTNQGSSITRTNDSSSKTNRSETPSPSSTSPQSGGTSPQP